MIRLTSNGTLGIFTFLYLSLELIRQQWSLYFFRQALCELLTLFKIWGCGGSVG
jgi:hypothetical protein